MSASSPAQGGAEAGGASASACSKARGVIGAAGGSSALLCGDTPASRALLFEVEAERVGARVEVDADVLLMLEVGQRRAAPRRVGTPRREVVDSNLQVRHRQLLAGPGRPHRRRVHVLDVEAQ